jgi:hypothetical protein
MIARRTRISSTETRPRDQSTRNAIGHENTK